MDFLPVPDLDGQEKTDGLHTVVAAVHVVAHEEVVGVGTPPAHPEELQQVVELAVDISAHCHRGAGEERYEEIYSGRLTTKIAPVETMIFSLCRVSL